MQLLYLQGVLERLGHTYDYEFDWTPKLNNASTPSGSLHASDAGEDERGIFVFLNVPLEMCVL